MEKQLDYWSNKKIYKKKMYELWKKKIYLYATVPLFILKIRIRGENVKMKLNHPEDDDRGKARAKKEKYEKFFKDIVKVYNNLDCYVYLIVNDHVTTDKAYIDKEVYYSEKKNAKIKRNNRFFEEINHYPFFSIVKPPHSNLICIPDAMFIQNYSKWSRVSNLPLKDYVKKVNKTEKYNWKNKNNKFVFKSQYWKYKEINPIVSSKIKNHDTTDKYLSIKGQIKNKYLLGSFLRWDTTYWQLLSNSVLFIIDGIHDSTLNTHPYLYKSFLSYYFNPYEHYIPIKLSEIDKVNEALENKDNYLKKVSENATRKASKLTYEKVHTYFGRLLVKYNKIYNS